MGITLILLSIRQLSIVEVSNRPALKTQKIAHTENQ